MSDDDRFLGPIRDFKIWRLFECMEAMEAKAEVLMADAIEAMDAIDSQCSGPSGQTRYSRSARSSPPSCRSNVGSRFSRFVFAIARAVYHIVSFAARTDRSAVDLLRPPVP